MLSKRKKSGCRAMSKNESYNEIGFFRPKFNKYRKIGFDFKYLLYRLNWYMAEAFHYVTRFPIHIDFETTNFCNLKCTMCPHGTDGAVQNKGVMDFELFKKVIDEGAREGLRSVKLNMRGEPLIHPKLTDMVAYAKQKGMLEVMFNTNGQLLSEDKIKGLIDAGIDYIIISIDGATKKTYEGIRIGGDFDRLVRNIDYLCRYRKSHKLRKPIIRLQFVRMKDNIHEISAYYKMWRDKVDVMTANDYSNRTGCYDRGTRNKDAAGRANCPHPWRRLSISWDGKVMICCGDWYMKGVIGDCNTQTIKEIWHSPRFYKIRELLKREELDKIPACKDCFVLASYKWRGR